MTPEPRERPHTFDRRGSGELSVLDSLCQDEGGWTVLDLVDDTGRGEHAVRDALMLLRTKGYVTMQARSASGRRRPFLHTVTLAGRAHHARTAPVCAGDPCST